MRKLITLELKRNRLYPYHLSSLICGIIMLGVEYLLASIPYIDPQEAEAALFSNYLFLAEIVILACMTVFTILSAVMAARFIVEEYSGKRAILLFSYPISRRQVLKAKLLLVFGYSTCAMFVCGGILQGIFFLSESIFPIGAGELNVSVIAQIIGFLFCCSVQAGVLGVLSLWIGFRKKSISLTLVAAVVLAVLGCQLSSVALRYYSILWGVLAVTVLFSIAAIVALLRQVENMEI